MTGTIGQFVPPLRRGSSRVVRDVLRTLNQISDPRFLKVLGVSMVLTVLLFAALLWTVAWFLGGTDPFAWAWLNTALDILGGIALLWIAILLFPGLAITVQSLLLEDVAAAVEAKHYPALPEPRPQGWGELIATGLKLTATVLALNLLLLPVYLALTFVPPLNVLLFYLVNGYLLGREYFETVALRRLPPAQARAMRQRFKGRVWLAGVFIAFLFTLPVVNLATPVLGTAFMLHLFQRLRGHPRAAGLTDTGAPGNRVSGGGGPVAATMLALLVTLGACASRTAPDAIEIVPASGFDPRRAVDDRQAGPALRARAALTPLPQGPRPRGSRPPDPAAELIGLPDELLARHLGAPSLVRRDGPAQVWQYASGACVLDVFLYSDGQRFHVEHVQIRDPRDGGAPDPWCYQEQIVSGAIRVNAGPSGAGR